MTSLNAHQHEKWNLPLPIPMHPKSENGSLGLCGYALMPGAHSFLCLECYLLSLAILLSHFDFSLLPKSQAETWAMKWILPALTLQCSFYCFFLFLCSGRALDLDYSTPWLVPPLQDCAHLEDRILFIPASPELRRVPGTEQVPNRCSWKA